MGVLLIHPWSRVPMPEGSYRARSCALRGDHQMKEERSLLVSRELPKRDKVFTVVQKISLLWQDKKDRLFLETKRFEHLL